MRLRNVTFGAALVAILPFGVGCEQSVQDAREDVQDAEIEAQQDIMEEKQDVDEAQLEGQQEVEEEKADVQEAQQEEAQENADTPDATETTTP
jgi:Sec-independent protein translocase protein TatA